MENITNYYKFWRIDLENKEATLVTEKTDNAIYYDVKTGLPSKFEHLVPIEQPIF